VFLLPAALASRGAAMGKVFAGSLTMGAGQFFTNPGLVFAVEGPGLNDFLNAAKEALGTTPAATMLHNVAIATASSWIPANHAAGVDPNQALREE
jgi:NADP-dependent aldehyde dehydrogenase